MPRVQFNPIPLPVGQRYSNESAADELIDLATTLMNRKQIRTDTEAARKRITRKDEIMEEQQKMRERQQAIEELPITERASASQSRYAVPPREGEVLPAPETPTGTVLPEQRGPGTPGVERERGRHVIPAAGGLPEISVPLPFKEDIQDPDTEVLSQEVWEKLPPVFKARWQPGQRVGSKEIGTVGMKILEQTQAKLPTTKSVYDRQAKQDVLRTEEQVAAEPDRYGPAQEARLTAAETRAEAGAARAAAATEAAAAKAEAAKTDLDNAADRIANGEPADKVDKSVRDAAVKAARAQGARVYTTQQQKDKVVVLESIQGDVARLKELLAEPKIAAYFGPAAGPITGGMSKLPEIPGMQKIPPEVHEARSLMLNLQDRTLRQRSGAQINVAEMKRITQFSPDPSHQLAKTLVNLDHMGKELGGLVDAQFKASAPTKAGTTVGKYKILSIE